MGKDPAFLFYPGDWDGGTKLFTRHIKGAYMDLLMCQFQSGHMTSHDLVFILGQPDYDLYWETKLKAKFVQDNEGKYYNQKLESEQIKRRKWCESRINNKEGKNQYSGHMTSHMGAHMENENENKDINKKKRNIFIKPSLDEITDYCHQRHNTVNSEIWLAHYESNGWMVGKNKMQNWKAAIRTWEKNNFESTNKPVIKTKMAEFVNCIQCGGRRLKSDVDAKGICLGRCDGAATVQR